MKDKKLNFLTNGVAKLPPGFLFEPTDEEIVFQYLKCKVFGLPLPVAVIPEINICTYDPWDLPGEVGNDKYFFCNEKTNVSRGGTCSGYWKSTGEEQLILSSTNADKQLIGLRKTKVYYKANKSIVAIKNAPIITKWKMHEFHMIILTCSSYAHCKSQQSLEIAPLALLKGGWKVCRILKNENKPDIISYISKTLKKRIREDIGINYARNVGFKLSMLENVENSSQNSSSSCWSNERSSISEKSSSDTEEISSNSSCLE